MLRKAFRERTYPAFTAEYNPQEGNALIAARDDIFTRKSWEVVEKCRKNKDERMNAEVKLMLMSFLTWRKLV